MTGNDKWNLIVEQYRELFNKTESEIQKVWESYCSELLNYKRLFGEIDSQRSIHIGSSERIIPDIILRINNVDVFDIELKQYNLGFDESFEKQLISYLNQTHISLGMIVCKKIYLYVYDYLNNKISKVAIPFEKDYDDGIKLLGLLDKNNYDEKKIIEFVVNKNRSFHNVEEIREQLSPELVRQLTYDYFIKSYSEDEVNKGLDDFKFIIENKKASSFIDNFSYDSEDEENEKTSKKFDIDRSNHVAKLIFDWLSRKEQSGEIKLYRERCGRKNIRFTTDELSKILPDAKEVLSGWGTPNFYFLEAKNYQGNAIKMQFAVTSINIPDDLRKVCDKINNRFPSRIQKTDWEWRTHYSTGATKISEKTSDAEIVNILEEQYNKLMSFVNRLVKEIES